MVHCRFTAAVAEMLVQSTQTELHLLPALPRDKWREGSVRGLRARGDVTVNVSWKEGNLQKAHLWTTTQTSLRTLHYGGVAVPVALTSGSVLTFDGRLKCLGARPIITTCFSSWITRRYLIRNFPGRREEKAQVMVSQELKPRSTVCGLKASPLL